jgi:hypothetical protein
MLVKRGPDEMGVGVLNLIDPAYPPIEPMMLEHLVQYGGAVRLEQYSERFRFDANTVNHDPVKIKETTYGTGINHSL